MKPSTPDKRVQQIIYLRPSLKSRIRRISAARQESLSAWFERAVVALLRKEERRG